MCFRRGNRPVLDPFWYDVEVAGAEAYLAVPKLYDQVALEDEEEVIRIRMRMPNKLAVHFDDHHVMSIELCDDFRRPEIRKGAELLGQIYSDRHDRCPLATAT